jgi:hypothetical protein
MPLVIDSHGRAIATVSEYRGSSIVAVGRNGNVQWEASTLNVEDRGEFGIVPKVAVDSKNRPLLAGQFQGGLGGSQAYAIERLDVRAGSPSLIDYQLTGPTQNDYVFPYLHGFAVDAQDRALVAATRHEGEDYHFLIERLSEDFTERESFSVPGLDYESGVDGLNAFAGNIVWGIRAGKDGAVYFWRNDRFGRITLPEQSDTKTLTE